MRRRSRRLIRVASDRQRLPVIVAHYLASADQRFQDAIYTAPTSFGFQRIGGSFLGLIPGRGKSRVAIWLPIMLGAWLRLMTK